MPHPYRRYCECTEATQPLAVNAGLLRRTPRNEDFEAPALGMIPSRIAQREAITSSFWRSQQRVNRGIISMTSLTRRSLALLPVFAPLLSPGLARAAAQLNPAAV